MLYPNWNWIDWNYGEKRGRKRGMKVAIITHFARMQQIDEFPALLDERKDCVYSLGSQIDHDLCYEPMNWKREMVKRVKIYRAEMGTKSTYRFSKSTFMMTMYTLKMTTYILTTTNL